jgi:hypothetical protein
MNAFLVFLATWISVFTLGLQSLNVNQRQYVAAAVTSLGIGAGHLALYRFMPSAHVAEIGAYLVGGVTGITSSIWAHERHEALARCLARSRRAGSRRSTSIATSEIAAARGLTHEKKCSRVCRGTERRRRRSGEDSYRSG